MLRPGSASLEFSVPYRGLTPEPAQGDPHTSFTVTLSAGAIPPDLRRQIKATAAFLIDSAHGTVALPALAQMIGCCALATGATGEALTLSLASSTGETATQRVARPTGMRGESGDGFEPGFEIETTAFGAAHILYEDDTLGLYILEIATGHSIPAHRHQVMREWELILDDGLLQQGRPVRRGDAFAWPRGQVHAYENPTSLPRRILCIDSPRFDPADEVALTAPPPLIPVAPITNYFA
jgi:quercetin dioxygenase-like cupin family protein